MEPTTTTTAPDRDASAGRARVAARLGELWTEARPGFEGRIDAIEAAIAELLAGAVAEETRAEAVAAAHKLAGALGTYGVTGGSELARELEDALDSPRIGVPGDVYGLAARVTALRDLVEAHRPATPAAETETVRVLVVGAGEAVETAGQVLRDQGHAVTRAADVAAAAAYLEASQPDVVVAPAALASPDGPDALGPVLVRTGSAATPMIAVFDVPDADALRRAFGAGAHDVVLAPIVGPELVARVERAADLVHLRASVDALAPAVASPPAPDHASSAEYDVLVVEDDEALIALLHHALTTSGLRVRMVGDGVTAAVLLADPAEVARHRSVLLDVSLPGLDGFGVLRAMRDAGTITSIPVVMLTARVNEDEVLAALELGAVDHVAKPFSRPILVQRLRRVLAG